MVTILYLEVYVNIKGLGRVVYTGRLHIIIILIQLQSLLSVNDFSNFTTQWQEKKILLTRVPKSEVSLGLSTNSVYRNRGQVLIRITSKVT